MMKNTEYAEYMNNIMEIFETCLTFIAELNVKEIQEQQINVKQEDCNLESQLFKRYMINRFRMVSFNATVKYLSLIICLCNSSHFHIKGLCHQAERHQLLF